MYRVNFVGGKWEQESVHPRECIAQNKEGSHKVSPRVVALLDFFTEHRQGVTGKDVTPVRIPSITVIHFIVDG